MSRRELEQEKQMMQDTKKIAKKARGGKVAASQETFKVPSTHMPLLNCDPSQKVDSSISQYSKLLEQANTTEEQKNEVEGIQEETMVEVRDDTLSVDGERKPDEGYPTFDPKALKSELNSVQVKSSLNEGEAKKSLSIEKKPVFDWACSAIAERLTGDEGKIDEEIYSEKDIEYTLDMLKAKSREFRQAGIIQPYYEKAHRTLKKTMEELNLVSLYPKLRSLYTECNVTTTFKLLLRCQLMYDA
jgi:hypothetical protein